MDFIFQIGMASLLGLATTSSSLPGAAIGLYLPSSKRPLARLLAFAAGSLISALAISSCGLVPGVVSGSSEAIASPV
jgi:hypothetical protein